MVLLLIILLLLAALIVTVTKQDGTEERTSPVLNDGLVCPIPSENIFQEKGLLLQDGLTLTGSTAGALTSTEDSPALVCAPTFSMQSHVLYRKLLGDGNCYAVSTEVSSFGVVLGLLVGNLCDATDCLILRNGLEESLGGSSASTLILEADQGQDYWLVVGGFGADVGHYVVKFDGNCSPTTSPTTRSTPSHRPSVRPTQAPVAVPQLCRDAPRIELVDGFQQEGTTIGVPPLRQGDPAGACRSGALFSTGFASVLYFAFSGDGCRYSFDTRSSDFDTALGLLGGDCDDCLARNDDHFGLRSQIIFETEMDATYYILLSGFDDNVGNFVLNIELSGECGPRPFVSEPPTFRPTFEPFASPTFRPTFEPFASPASGPTTPTTVRPTFEDLASPAAPAAAPTTSFDPTATWRQLGADVDGEAAGDQSGWSVALSSDGYTVAIGAPLSDNGGINNRGHVRVLRYELSTALWNQQGSDIDGEASDDNFGHSVALSADGLILAAGAHLNDGNGSNSGHVRVFAFSTSTALWNQRGQDLDGEAASDGSGWSVDLSKDGTVVAIGAFGNDDNGSAAGHVRVFAFNAGSSQWIQRGQDLGGEASNDRLGTSVALSADGMIMAAGAWLNDGNGNNSGHVRVFAYQSTSARWTQLGQDIDGEASGDYSGYVVALSANGRTVAVGAYGNNGVNGSDSGHVRVWTLPLGASAWTQMGQDLDGEAAGDDFGLNLALSANGRTVAVGARNNDGNGSSSGHVRIFDFNPTLSRWQQVGEDLDGEAFGDNFGGEFGRHGVALSADGRVMAAGAPYNDGNGSDAGHVRVFARF